MFVSDLLLCGCEIRLRHLRDEPLGHPSQVLRRSSQQKLIARSSTSSQPQPIKPEDAFEMREQDFDLLAAISMAPEELVLCADERRSPKVVVKVRVLEAYLHCAKALMRSRLWDPAGQIDRASLPTMGQMVKDHAGLADPAETQEEMLRRYASDL